MGQRRGYWTAVIVVLFSVFARWASATTFIYESDYDLAATAEAVVFGKVITTTPEYLPDVHGVRTRVRILVDRVVAGRVPLPVVDVLEPGGELPGLREKIFGAPDYRPNERVLAFLHRDRNGNFRTVAMALGKYHVEATATGMWIGRRNFTGAALLQRRAHRLEPHARSQERPLADVLADVQAAFAARGEPTSTITLPPVPEDNEVEFSAPFTLLGQGRWFAPDTGEPVSFWLDPNGMQSLGAPTSHAAVAEAMEAWNQVPKSSLRLQVAGVATPTRFAGCNPPTRILFDDPFQEIANPQNCSGVLAVGGYCPGTTTMVWNGVRFSEIVLGKIVFNDGWDTCGVWSACNLAEVATHELGHAFGLGHSTDRAATMAPTAHFDGRCAAVMADDADGVRFLYGTPEPDVVLLPRTPITMSIPANSTTASRTFSVKLRNADSFAWGAAPLNVRLDVRNGTCPAGTVLGVDFDPKAPGAQDSTTLAPRQTVTARVQIAVTTDQIPSMPKGATYRCTLEAEALAAVSTGADRTPANNRVHIVVNVRHNRGDSNATQVVRETSLASLSPLRISLPRTMPVQTRTVHVRVRNADTLTNLPRTVNIEVDPGDCPAGTLASWDFSADVGDQHAVSLLPGRTARGALVLTPPNAGFFSPSRQSPARCTMWVRSSTAEGETNTSDNITPLVVDVVDGLDF